MPLGGKVKSNKWFVYLVHLSGSNYYKIGHTNNVNKRLATINTASPHAIELVASWEFDRSMKAQGFEKLIHKIFASDRIGNKEWFTLLESDKLLIDAEYSKIIHGLKPIPARLESAFRWCEILKSERIKAENKSLQTDI